MSAVVLVMYVILAVLMLYALTRGRDVFLSGIHRGIEQFAVLIPRMVLALLGAGFLAQLIPTAFIGRFLGEDSGLTGILIASAVGLIVPAGPVIAFSMAAVFARAGASVPALIAFITSWSIFATHRIFIYEIPLLGLAFTRLRLISAAALPLIAGLLTLIAGLVVDFPVVARP